MPVISETTGGGAHQLIHGRAGIFSRTVCGVIARIHRQKLSVDEGYEPAIETSFWERPLGKVP